MNFNQISINEVLDSSILTCQKKIKEKNITIDKRIQPGNHFTIADNYLISLAFDSILDNSANFSTTDSVITINVNRVEDLILISIADQGKGFTSETLDNLFKIFHSDDINNHSNGIGLSLALVKLILDAHNGHIEVKNNLIGAEVIITLPWSWDIQS
jgi:signal transduction histidine kinase